MNRTIQRMTIAAVLAVGVTVGGTGVAAAAPNYDVSPEQVNPYCGPGQSVTVFDVKTMRPKTTCTDKVRVPHKVHYVTKPSIWKPWQWRF